MNAYTFVTDTETRVIEAEDCFRAMNIANREMDLPRDFYGWFGNDAGTNFRAGTGVWD